MILLCKIAVFHFSWKLQPKSFSFFAFFPFSVIVCAVLSSSLTHSPLYIFCNWNMSHEAKMNFLITSPTSLNFNEMEHWNGKLSKRIRCSEMSSFSVSFDPIWVLRENPWKFALLISSLRYSRREYKIIRFWYQRRRAETSWNVMGFKLSQLIPLPLSIEDCIDPLVVSISLLSRLYSSQDFKTQAL